MTPSLLNEAFLTKITIIKVFPCRSEHVCTIFRDLDARGGRKLRTDTHTHETTTVPRVKNGFHKDETPLQTRTTHS